MGFPWKTSNRAIIDGYTISMEVLCVMPKVYLPLRQLKRRVKILGQEEGISVPGFGTNVM